MCFVRTWKCPPCNSLWPFDYFSFFLFNFIFLFLVFPFQPQPVKADDHPLETGSALGLSYRGVFLSCCHTMLAVKVSVGFLQIVLSTLKCLWLWFSTLINQSNKSWLIYLYWTSLHRSSLTLGWRLHTPSLTPECKPWCMQIYGIIIIKKFHMNFFQHR